MERILLSLSLVASLLCANLWDGYSDFADRLHWFSNGPLLALFFYLIGNEIRHEFVEGEFSQPRKALIPVSGALGGMFLPATIFAILQPDSRSWLVAMPTDIALVLGVLALLGKRVSRQLRIFLLTLAVADDLFSIVILGVLYGQELSLDKVLFSLGAVALGALIPKRPHQALVLLSALVVVPLYILLNFGFEISVHSFTSTTALALSFSRVIGKCLGITFFVYGAARVLKMRVPISRGELFGGALLAGNGLTVALFMAEISAQQNDMSYLKAGLLMAIIVCSLAGSAVILSGLTSLGRNQE